MAGATCEGKRLGSKHCVEVLRSRVVAPRLQICLNFDCNLLTLNGTNPCESNRRAGGWRTAGGNPDGAGDFLFFFLTFFFFFFTQTTHFRSTALGAFAHPSRKLERQVFHRDFSAASEDSKTTGRPRAGVLECAGAAWAKKTTCFCGS